MLRIGVAWATIWLAFSACGGESTSDATASGGSAGVAPGLGGSSGSGGAAARRECDTAAECRLLADCCTCDAVPIAAGAQPSCEVDCVQDACSARRVEPEMVQCVGGRCILGYDCRSSFECASVPPNCSRGQIASGREGCWGSCIDVFECAEVQSCSVCEPSTTVCMQRSGEVVPSAHCVEVPAECLLNRTCACLGWICQAPFGECFELGSNIIGCDCPYC